MADANAPDVPLLDVCDLACGYGAIPVWSHVDLTLYAGELALLLGPNGAGKSTLLSCIAGWMRPSSGVVLLRGKRLDGRAGALRRHVAYVSDVPAFYDDLTAREHVDFMLNASCAPRARRDRAQELLEEFGIAHAVDAYPSAFSRGMRQKLALVLAFMMEPELLLLDEPTGPLDTEACETLGHLVRRALDGGAAVLMSCHHALPGVKPSVVYRLAGGTIAEDAGNAL